MARKKKSFSSRDYIYKAEGFEPSDYPGVIAENPEEAIWFISSIYIYGFKSFEDDDYISLHSDLLAMVLGSGGLVKKMREALIENKLINCNGRYEVGRKSLGYRLGAVLADTTFRKYVPTRTAARRIAKFRAECNRDKGNFTPAHDYAKEFVKDIKIRGDYERDIPHLVKTDDGDKRRARVNLCINQLTDIENENLGCSVCEYGRLHTPFSRLVKEGRAYIDFGHGKPNVEIDIRNSQIYFLSLVIAHEVAPQIIPSPHEIYINRKDNRERDRERNIYTLMSEEMYLPDDFINFIQDCCAGQIYERILEVLGKTDRDKIKKAVITFFYGPTCYQSKVGDALIQLYPFVMEQVVRLKERHGYEYIARTLQRYESNIIYGGIVNSLKEFHKGLRFLTIHDSFMCEADNLETLKGVIVDIFRSLPWQPEFRITHFETPQDAPESHDSIPDL